MGLTRYFGDRWVAGKSIQDMAPRLLSYVSKRRINKRTVSEALENDIWLNDLQGNISVESLMEFLEIWGIISNLVLTPGTPDKHIWRLSSSGQYTSKSAYDALSKELFCLSPIDEFGKPGPLLNAAFLCGWSLIRDAGLLISYLVVAFRT
jgi:hypothetical protein